MDSYEFMCGITHDLGNIRAFFDATMALYQIMGEYNGFAVVGQQIDKNDSAIVSYTILPPEDKSIIDRFMEHINVLRVGMYNRCYTCMAEMPNPNVILITLNGSVMEIQG